MSEKEPFQEDRHSGSDGAAAEFESAALAGALGQSNSRGALDSSGRPSISG